MPKAKDLILLNRYFFAAIFLYLAAGLLFLLKFSKADGFLALAPYHSLGLDYIFIVYTNFGNGLFSIGLGLLLLLLRQFNLAWLILVAYAVSGLLSQLIKELVFSPRPREFFKFREHIHLIDGITLTGNSSFPSGHSTSAFALATMLALTAKNKKWGWLYIFPAVLVCYSRVYLSQHFPQDVLAGSLLGFLSSLFVYYLFTNKLKRFM